MNMLKLANDIDIYLCVAYCIVVLGFSLRFWHVQVLQGRRRYSLVAAVAQAAFMCINTRALSNFGKVLDDEGMPFAPAVFWPLRISICLLAIWKVDDMYSAEGRRLKKEHERARVRAEMCRNRPLKPMSDREKRRASLV